jgi:type IV secretory pathway TrbD component
MRVFIYSMLVSSQSVDLLTTLRGFARGAVETNPLAQTPGALVLVKVLAVLMVMATLMIAARFGLRVWFVVAYVTMIVAGLTFATALHNLLVS